MAKRLPMTPAIQLRSSVLSWVRQRSLLSSSMAAVVSVTASRMSAKVTNSLVLGRRAVILSSKNRTGLL